ncbi:4-coumarate--CoA ligase-like 5 [Homarus americanus]|uniref:4-coumarate--CoA ligase-like 5 n=1 Tax=Homarus americanus TaxID=6706 RepID=UPI001C461E0E|nr:4-coumarate--CoA ligase-like 5 [Homarus americanus]
MSGQQQQQQDGGSRRSTEPRILEWDGPGPLPAIPNINYAVFMLESMAAYGDAVAVEDADTRQHWKYSELCSAVPRVSGGLAKAGVTRGEVVLLLMPTHMDFPLILLSILHCGAVCVPVNPLYSPEELVHVLNVSEARWAVVHPDVAPAAEAAFSLLPHGTLKKMWVLGNDSTRPCIAHLMTHDPVPPSTKIDNEEPRSAALNRGDVPKENDRQAVIKMERTCRVKRQTYELMKPTQKLAGGPCYELGI